MKKILSVLLILFLFTGCSKSQGTFTEGTKDMDRLYDDICKKINEGEWNMPALDEIWWSQARIEKAYQLDMTMVEEAYVKSSAIEAQFSEIAFFKVTKDNEATIKEAISYRLKSLNQTWGSYMLDAQEQLQNVYQGRIGQYYFMILGEDSKKVVNYIQDMK